MSSADWNISGPIDFAWTPAELAQIGRAVQAFQAALPGNEKIMHLVRIDGLTVLDGSIDVVWPQPGEAQPSGIPDHLEGAEVAQWLVDHPDSRLIKP